MPLKHVMSRSHHKNSIEVNSTVWSCITLVYNFACMWKIKTALLLSLLSELKLNWIDSNAALWKHHIMFSMKSLAERTLLNYFYAQWQWNMHAKIKIHTWWLRRTSQYWHTEYVEFFQTLEKGQLEIFKCRLCLGFWFHFIGYIYICISNLLSHVLIKAHDLMSSLL